MTNDQFIKTIATSAQKDWKLHKILPSLIIAQAILESAWGKSGLTKKANNLFGMKSSASWKGNIYNMRTAEQKKDGTVYYVNAPFRAYDTWDDCIYDHGVLLKSKRYAKVHGETDYQKACCYIREAGYATDINYTSKLISLISMYKLYQYDPKK